MTVSYCIFVNRSREHFKLETTSKDQGGSGLTVRVLAWQCSDHARDYDLLCKKQQQMRRPSSSRDLVILRIN